MSMLETLPDWLKLLSGAVGLLTTVVVIAVYLTKLKLEGTRQLKDAQAVIDQQRTTIGALEASSQALSQSVALLREGRENAASVLMDINRLMSEGSHLVLASAESVLIPDPHASDSLVFLAVHGTAEKHIKHLRIPIVGSVAGRVLTSGAPAVYSADSSEPRHEDADMKAEFQSRTILSLPLTHGGRVVGVLQYVNRSDGGTFGLKDSDTLRSLCTEIAYRVERLTSDASALRLLGIAQQAESSQGSFLFLDLTRSSALFDALLPPDVLLLLNEYYDRMISRALREGAMLDRLLGDGMLLRLNVPKRVPHHATAAIQCALALQSEFADLRAEWLRIGRPVDFLGHRIGISTGFVIAAQMGHPQFLSYTVLGKTVNEAARLCEAARSTSGGIAVCETTRERAVKDLGESVRFTPLEGTQRGFHVERLA